MLFRKKKDDSELKDTIRMAQRIQRMRESAWAFAEKQKEKREKVIEEKKAVKLDKIKEKLDQLTAERLSAEFGIVTDSKMKMPKETPVKDILPPELCYQLDQYGRFTEHPTKEDEDPARYWRRKHKTVGLILLISGLILFVIIINNSPIADIIFNAIIGFFNFIISIFLNLITGLFT